MSGISGTSGTSGLIGLIGLIRTRAARQWLPRPGPRTAAPEACDRRARAWLGLALATCLALPLRGLAADAAPDRSLQVQASQPRAYGYQVGDRVQREVSIWAPAGWTLDEATLPRPGLRGRSIELLQVQHQARAEDGGRRHRLALQYQVFLAPPTVRTLEIPAFRLDFAVTGRIDQALIEAWPLTVAPLVQAEAPERRGLGELQPDRPPPLVETGAREQRLLAYAAAAGTLGLLLALLLLGPPWRAARRQPFGRAWRELRRLPPQPADARWLEACQRLHQALNQSAGEVVFEHGLAAFIARRPGFAPLQADLLRFLRDSRAQFYGGAAREAGDAVWLKGLVRRCRDAERGLA